MKGIEAAGGCDPECAFAILEKLSDRIAREPVQTTKLIDGFSMDAIDALIDSAHPQAACAIVMKRKHRQGAGIELTGNNRLHTSGSQALQTQLSPGNVCHAYPDT